MIKSLINKVVNPNGLDDILSRFPSNVGSHGFDPWGFNIKGVRHTLGLGKLLYEKYFRVEAIGLENIPKEGRLLVVANHSGQLPLDGILLAYAMLTNTHGPRAAKAMMERFIPTVPFISVLFSQIGGIVGDPVNCQRMLNMEEAIIVFPEGSRGISKPFKKRYKLQKFGTGFMNLAVRNDTPVVPVGIVGMEESILSLGTLDGLGKSLGTPAIPMLLPFVFPTKVYIHFGKPMYFENKDLREDVLKENVDLVKDEIRSLIDMGKKKRKGIFR